MTVAETKQEKDDEEPFGIAKSSELICVPDVTDAETKRHPRIVMQYSIQYCIQHHMHHRIILYINYLCATCGSLWDHFGIVLGSFWDNSDDFLEIVSVY